MTSPIHVSGLLVNVRPDKADGVCALLERIPGVEVHAASAEGRLVVTLENSDDREMTATFERVQATPDVLSVSLIYHHAEDG